MLVAGFGRHTLEQTLNLPEAAVVLLTIDNRDD